MPYAIIRFDNTANDTNITTVNSEAATDLTNFTASNRQGLSVTNTSATRTLYCKVKSGTSTPTITATNYHFKLAPGADKQVSGGGSVKVWAINDSSPSANSTATVVELL
jgi:hypothetical protein